MGILPAERVGLRLAGPEFAAYGPSATAGLVTVSRIGRQPVDHRARVEWQALSSFKSAPFAMYAHSPTMPMRLAIRLALGRAHPCRPCRQVPWANLLLRRGRAESPGHLAGLAGDKTGEPLSG
ncbi:uncharacterized protein UV8b_07756 [Ustilaginoidea virens]|uniref:Uncharacterized protein n=1 Tax=Ustilaginoidea virens TaxID=1159556 RepID=A0A8E5HXL7_USTVR|nr:uncharacterized protein UV8b_07756 [Ustilaginoidea virens]QUC23515.1 hypothetical protein UV8b_07756 [Ustilaginoidea virens]